MFQTRKGRLIIGGIEFDRRELKDLALAWVALSVAFTFFLSPRGFIQQLPLYVDILARRFVVMMVAVGSAFLLHELAHKIVAIRFGQVAAFRADYGMLGLAVLSGLAGFIFAAPGAVYHRGYITDRENGIVAVAGPVTNIVLALAFLPFVFLPGFVGDVARMGLIINVFLAAFNMIPFGPLDGRTVLDWSKAVFVATFLGALAFGVVVLVVFV